MSELAVGISLRLTGANTVAQATRDLQTQIKETERRFERLASSGKLSQEQLGAAAVKMREKVAASRKELEQLQNTVGQTAVSKYAANIEARRVLGIRAEKDIQNEIKRTEVAYQTLAKSGVLSAQQLARAQDASLRKIRELRKEMGEVEKTTRSVALISPGAVAAVAGAAMLAKPAVTRAMGYDHTVADITNTLFSERDKAGRLAGKAEVKAAISAALLEGGGDRDQAAATLKELLSSGDFSKESSFKMLGTIQKAATAAPGTDSKDLAGIALALKRAGVSEDRLPAMLSKTIRSGQLGGFELTDMAKSLPEAMALAKKLGMSGEDGYERLLVSMQSSVLTAGTKSGAANNLVNLLGKIDSADTAADFKKQGINLTDELAKGAGKGEDRITTFTRLIDQVVQKDPKMKALAKESDRLASIAGDKKNPQREEALKQMQAIYTSGSIGKILQDRQALMGFLAEKQGQAGDNSLARRVREGMRADNGQELETSFAVMDDTVSAQTQRLENAKLEGQDKALTGAGAPLKDFYQGVVSTAEQFPVLTASVSAATTALGLLAGAAGLNALLGGGGKAGAGGLLSRIFAGGAASTVAQGAAGGTLSALSLAAVPLTAMAGVSAWAGDTSNDKGRVDALQGISGLLSGLLQAIGIDKTREIEQRRAEMRAELEVTVRDDRVSVSKTRLEGTNMTASMNTGNLWKTP
jgi:hypothetical protein